MSTRSYCLKEELEQLNSLAGEKLAFVYSNQILASYRNGIDACEARPEYMKWACKKIGEVRRAILEYRKMSTTEYPFPYNQQLRMKHDGSYKNAVPEKEIVRGLMNYQRLGGKIKSYAGESRQLCNIVDYEVPMFCVSGGSVSGRIIDAVGRSCGSKGNRLYIIEAKKNNSPETILRCLLEAFSYSLFVNRARFRESFGVRQDATIVLSPLIFEDGIPNRDLQSCLFNPAEKLIFNTLLARIKEEANVDIEFFVIRKSDFLKEGKIIFPDVNETVFKAEWLD